MKYYRDLYISEGLEKKKNKVINKLESNKLQHPVFLTILSQDPQNHLEIISSTYVLQPSFPKEDILVVGICKDYGESLEMIEKILDEVYDKTGNTDIRGYILKREMEC